METLPISALGIFRLLNLRNMPPDNYFSFLMCSRTNQVDLYINGLPIGKIEQSSFVPHSFVLPSGAKVQLTKNNVTMPFANFDELKTYLIQAISKIEISK